MNGLLILGVILNFCSYTFLVVKQNDKIKQKNKKKNNCKYNCCCLFLKEFYFHETKVGSTHITY